MKTSWLYQPNEKKPIQKSSKSPTTFLKENSRRARDRNRNRVITLSHIRADFNVVHKLLKLFKKNPHTPKIYIFFGVSKVIPSSVILSTYALFVIILIFSFFETQQNSILSVKVLYQTCILEEKEKSILRFLFLITFHGDLILFLKKKHRNEK